MEKERACIICNQKPAGSWLYNWKGQQGNACQECGQWFHSVGDYLNDRAAALMSEEGIEIMQTKEKFGGFRIYMCLNDEKAERQKKFVQALYRQYKIMFPEFSWEWDFCD